MSAFCLGFNTLALPKQTRRPRRQSRCPSAVVSEDQWDQYDSQSENRRLQELEIARSTRSRHRHHHVFQTPASKQTFKSASKRFVNSMRDHYMKGVNEGMTDKQLWIVESIADDTFGMLQGAPDPPRAMVIESVDGSGQKDENDMVTRWTRAVNRVGKALSIHESYNVDYASWGGASSCGCFHRLKAGYLVGCEVLNANWSSEGSIGNMRETLLNYAKEAVDSGHVSMYEVLQSVDEPTVFKTVETYACMDDLREHMKSLDPGFEKRAMEFRAAVNRVRQLYRCVESLHDAL